MLFRFLRKWQSRTFKYYLKHFENSLVCIWRHDQAKTLFLSLLVKHGLTRVIVLLLGSRLEVYNVHTLVVFDDHSQATVILLVFLKSTMTSLVMGFKRTRSLSPDVVLPGSHLILVHKEAHHHRIPFVDLKLICAELFPQWFKANGGVVQQEPADERAAETTHWEHQNSGKQVQITHSDRSYIVNHLKWMNDRKY